MFQLFFYTILVQRTAYNEIILSSILYSRGCSKTCYVAVVRWILQTNTRYLYNFKKQGAIQQIITLIQNNPFHYLCFKNKNIELKVTISVYNSYRYIYRILFFIKPQPFCERSWGKLIRTILPGHFQTDKEKHSEKNTCNI